MVTPARDLRRAPAEAVRAVARWLDPNRLGSQQDRVRRRLVLEAIEQRARVVGASAAVDRRLQQSPGFRALAAIERRHTVVQQLFGLPLTFRQRAARPFDVGTRTRMAAIEKQRPRPDVDRLVVVGRKVVIQAGEEQLLDFCVAIGVRRGVDRA